jgi:putative phosphoesterase
MKEQLLRLRTEAKGVLANEDPENVHRMRVASRRTRTALDIFGTCFRRKQLRRWSQTMKAVTKALGAARDTDVQIIYLQGALRSASEEERLGIEWLLKRKREARASLQPALVDAIHELLDCGQLEEIVRATRGSAVRRASSKARARAIAFVHIARRVAELRTYAPFVHHEDQKEKHHQMRIAAKHLRYTLEPFDSLFADGLSEELATVKKLQEVLGEMHDCDFWVLELQSLLKKKAGEDAVELRPGIRRILAERSSMRESLYRQFVGLWDEAESEHLLDTLLDKTDSQAEEGLKPDERFVAKLEREPSQKIAVIGDIHANLPALEAVLADAERNDANITLNTGDTVGFGPFPEETVNMLMQKGVVSVLGNFDLKVLRAKGDEPGQKTDNWYAENWTNRRLSERTRRHLASLPSSIQLKAAGRRIMVVHGSPDSMDEYIDPNTPEKRLRQLAEEYKVDLLVAGHAHRPLDKVVAGTRFINPGSVGRQDDGDPRASYAILRLDPLTVERRRVEYDVTKAVEAMKEQGLPASFQRTLTEGRSLSYLNKKWEKVNGKKDVVAACWKLHDSYLGSEEHSRTVARLGLILFDCLRDLHGLGEEDRKLLECAAACHDLGWVEGRRAHHKTSMRMVIEDDELPLTDKERIVIAVVARYHRKALPDKRHAHYCNLSNKDRKRVDKLAAIIRVADGLDYSHRKIVDSLTCEHDADRIILHLAHRAEPETEEEETHKKADLMMKVFRRDLVLVWEGT